MVMVMPKRKVDFFLWLPLVIVSVILFVGGIWEDFRFKDAPVDGFVFWYLGLVFHSCNLCLSFTKFDWALARLLLNIFSITYLVMFLALQEKEVTSLASDVFRIFASLVVGFFLSIKGLESLAIIIRLQPKSNFKI
jgi:hypothetical protein